MHEEIMLYIMAASLISTSIFMLIVMIALIIQTCLHVKILREMRKFHLQENGSNLVNIEKKSELNCLSKDHPF